MASIFHVFFFIAFVFPVATFSQRNGSISVGALLRAEDNSIPWLSTSGDFAFGFQKLQDSRDNFLLAIWFDKIPQKTICWYERSSYPVLRGSTVQLNAEGGLILRDPQNSIVWTSSDPSTGGIASGFLNDTGNFLLLSSDSTRLWESFRNLTDTIVPTQTIEIGEMLISKKSETNFSQGRFYARMAADGNFVFNTGSVRTNSDFYDEYYSSPSLSPITIPSDSDNYYRATLDFDGVFTQYFHPRDFSGSPGWTTVESWPDNICLEVNGRQGSGACGYNSVCKLENKRPICSCPRGFSLADSNDSYGDCVPLSTFSTCTDGDKGLPADSFQLIEITDTDWPFNDYAQTMPSTEENCRTSCLEDCFCNVAIYRSDRCWKKRLPLSNGKIDMSLNVKAFLKFRKDDVPLLGPTPSFQTANSPNGNKKTLIIVGSAILASSVFLNFLLITTVCLGVFLVHKRKISITSSPLDSAGSRVRCFSYEELEQATVGFTEELGRGSSAIVYKGMLPNASKTVVAVKKMKTTAEDLGKEFRAEMNAIGHIHHKNLVNLIGFCDEGRCHLLVYEFMSNGTLASYLFGIQKPNWRQRSEIAIGVARGLAYLHEECCKQIIHCDIKPQNILVDEYYNARISDFGLAKLLMLDQSETLTNIRGTKGYVAPEWFRKKPITAKVDVYSFGVVLLEIIACRKNLEDMEIGREGISVLTERVLDCFEERRLDMVVENDCEALMDMERVERFLKVGIWCIQEDASSRPSMKKAYQMLEGLADVEDPALKSSY